MITFYKLDELDDAHIDYAVIAAKYRGKWVFCRHKERTTLELAGGHKEPHETPLAAARRELYEETGATACTLTPLTIYSVTHEDGSKTYGLFCYGEIEEMGPLPHSEMEEVVLMDDEPKRYTYPEIMPHLMEYVKTYLAAQ